MLRLQLCEDKSACSHRSRHFTVKQQSERVQVNEWASVWELNVECADPEAEKGQRETQ